MRRYLRLISVAETDGAAELRRALDELRAEFSEVTELEEARAHPRGGYSVFLFIPDRCLDQVLEGLVRRGWSPCI